MEIRFLFYFAAFVAVILTFYGVNYTTEIDELRQEHTAMLSQSEELAKALNIQKQRLTRKQEIIPYMVAATKMEEEAAEWRKKAAQIKEEINRTEALFVALVKRTRTDAPGMIIPEMHLANGQHLKGAKIVRLEGHTLTLAHEGGITNVHSDDLPADLRGKFGYALDLPGLNFAGEVDRSSGKPGFVTIPAGNGSATDSKKSGRPLGSQPTSSADRYRTGDPGLWNQVTREELGRAYIPGQGWLQVGPNGPIPKAGR